MNGKETAPSRPPNPALPYREDCWSEEATATLVEAWGDRFLELNRGNLRQKDWQEVADAVNSCPSAVKKPPRTDVQCKNRIDTVKKKYKAEKAKVSASNGAVASQWPFYSRLDELIGSSVPSSSKKPSPPLALPLPHHRKNSPLPAAIAASVRPEKRPAIALPVDDSFFRRNYSAAAAAAAAADEEEDGGSESESASSRSSRERSVRGNRGDDEGDGIRELARAIVRFGEIYERVEGLKQRQMMELEKQRMEFMKGMEFQRMQIFVDSQVKLQKIKRAKRGDSGLR